MKRKHRDQNGKAIPWVRTRFAVKYLAFRTLQSVMVCAAAEAQIRAIRFSDAPKEKKAMAIVTVTANTVSALAKINRYGSASREQKAGV